MTAAPTTKPKVEPKPKHPKFKKMWDGVELKPQPKRATFKKMWEQAGQVTKPETTFQRMWRGKAPTPEPKPTSPPAPTMAPADVEYPIKREPRAEPREPSPAEHMQRTMLEVSKVKPATFGEPPVGRPPIPVDTRLVLQVANQLAADAGIKGKWAAPTKEERGRGIPSQWRGEQTFEIPPGEGLVDYVTDLAAGLTAYVAELILAKKVMARTGLPKAVQAAGAWEAVSQAKGEPLGSGAARGLVFYSIAQAPVTVGIKTLAQSGALAGMTKAQGGDWADALISAAIPWAFRGIDATSNSLMGRAMQVRTPVQRLKFRDFLWRRAKTIKGKVYAPGERAKEIRLRRRAVTEARPEAEPRAPERALALPAPARPAPAAPAPPVAPAEKPAAKQPWDWQLSEYAKRGYEQRMGTGKPPWEVPREQYERGKEAMTLGEGRAEIERIARALHPFEDLPSAMKAYAEDFKYDRPSMVRRFRDVQPTDKVTVYRAVDPDDPNVIRPGDWVALERSYAEGHAEAGYGEGRKGKIVKRVLPASQVAWAGTSVDEWIYSPPELRDVSEQIGTHQALVRAAAEMGKPVPPEVLREYESEPWAKAALAKMEKPAAKVPPGPERGIATRKLRQQIRAVVAKRGIPQSEWRKLALEHGGERQLRNLTLEGLERVYAAVKKARPKKIGFKAVVTPKTEKKIQTLKARLLQSGQTTPEDFTRQMQELRIKQPGYVDAKQFITERDAKELIHKMLDEGPAIREREAAKRAFAKPDQKGVAAHADGIDKEVTKARVKREAKGKLAKAGALSSMRHYTVNLQEQTGLPFHDLWEGMNRTHLRIRADIEKMHGRLQAASPEYKAVAKDKESAQRISDYIESKLPDGPKAPTEITADEIAVAKEIERITDEFKNDVRYARFMDHYYQKAEIRDAPQSELTKATDIYEGQGPEALREYLDHRPWGVIRKGYTPRELLVGRIQLRKPSAIAFGKGHIKVRTAGQQPQDRTIFQRLDSYMRQIWNITRLEPKARALIRLHDENVSKFAKPRAIREGLELAINESKGYPQPGGPINRILRRVSGQAMRAVFFRPVMSLRNLFQNPAFNEDFSFGAFVDVRNKTLTEADWAYFNSQVDQTGPMRRQFLMQEERALPGLRFISKIADKLAHYPLADKTNRLGAFWARINRVRRALAGKDLSDPKAVKQMMDQAGFADLELTQQHRALEALARYGPEVMARYVAAEHTMNVHFPYERAQRSPAEMGATGRTLASLLAFPRAWGERIYREMRKVGRGGTYTARRRALGRVVHMTLIAGVWGLAFMKLTGRKRNPYNPLNILNWTPGGLVVGAATEISKTVYLINQAAQGDRTALNKLPAQMTRMANLYIVGYEMASDLVDVLLKTKGADRHALRKIRAMLDKQYRPRVEHYKAERTLIENIQKAVLGVEGESKKKRRYRR